jgi:hypothetical protein|nr:hypothetical protein [Paraprevotella clara]DAV71935.1 MAG TPA: hypothetical protein [Caudoviricetes sp.]
MNITKETISKLEEFGYNVWADDKYGFVDMDDYKNATHIGIGTKSDSDDWFCKSFKTPNEKEVTVEWVLSKINKESSYKNLSQYLRRIFDYSISVYPASYGIGVDTFGNYKVTAKNISDKLEELGLKYRNEFSEGRWVYRFIVSKDSENMRILKSLKSA